MADPTPETWTHDQASRHDPVYDRLHETAEFTELRRRYRGFVFPATVAFLSWYLLYVVMSNWAPDFMSQKLWGNINVALVFGLLQFVTTFLLAWHLQPSSRPRSSTRWRASSRRTTRRNRRVR